MAMYHQDVGILLLQRSLKRLFVQNKENQKTTSKTQAKCILLLSDICGKDLLKIYLVHFSSGNDLLNHYCQNTQHIFY